MLDGSESRYTGTAQPVQVVVARRLVGLRVNGSGRAETLSSDDYGDLVRNAMINKVRKGRESGQI